MNRYVVWSTHVDEDAGTKRDVVEVTRTDKQAAEQDADLITSVIHRTAWVQDSQFERRSN
jgi:hypothetical protein